MRRLFPLLVLLAWAPAVGVWDAWAQEQQPAAPDTTAVDTTAVEAVAMDTTAVDTTAVEAVAPDTTAMGAVAADSSVAPVRYLYGDDAAVRSSGVAQVRRRIAQIGAGGRARQVIYPIIVVVPSSAGQGTAAPAMLSSPSQPGASPTVTDVERALLQNGLFRTIDVVFRFNSSTLLPASAPTLDAVGEVLVKYPQLYVEVSGHTDAVGDAAYNQQLSEARAGSVRQYLLDRFAIAPERLTARGFGETQPVASNDHPTGRSLNRRVEFRVPGR